MFTLLEVSFFFFFLVGYYVRSYVYGLMDVFVCECEEVYMCAVN